MTEQTDLNKDSISAPAPVDSSVPAVDELVTSYPQLPNSANSSQSAGTSTALTPAPAIAMASSPATATIAIPVSSNLFGQRSQPSSVPPISVPSSAGLSLTKPTIVKRGGKTVVSGANSVPPKPQIINRPAPVSIPTTTQGGTFIKMIPAVVGGSPGSSVLVPSAPNVLAKPGLARAPIPTKVPVKPIAISGTSVAAAAAAQVAKKPIPATSKVLPMPNKALPVPTTITTKANTTRLAAVDKNVQQRKQLADTLNKLKKIEKHVIQAHPDHASPFTFGEIFQQTAVSFSKMASLTSHISLESLSPAEQRRWTPEMVSKFMSSVTTFATSLRDIGEELKKRHNDQLTRNLKRKAEDELANAKKAAAEAAKVIQPVVVVPISIPTAQLAIVAPEPIADPAPMEAEVPPAVVINGGGSLAPEVAATVEKEPDEPANIPAPSAAETVVESVKEAVVMSEVSGAEVEKTADAVMEDANQPQAENGSAGVQVDEAAADQADISGGGNIIEPVQDDVDMERGPVVEADVDMISGNNGNIEHADSHQVKVDAV